MHTRNLALFAASTFATQANVTHLCSMSDGSEDVDFTLADLADLDVSDVQEIRFESLPAGAYGFKIVTTDLSEKPNRDNEKRFIAEFNLEVVEVRAVVKKGVDPESLIGKRHKETFYIVPEKAVEGIGRLRAAIADMGFANNGQLGPLLESLVDQTFYGKIKEQKDRDDPSRVYARLQLDAKKK